MSGSPEEASNNGCGGGNNVLGATEIEALGYLVPKRLDDGTWGALQPMAGGGCGLYRIVDTTTWAEYWSFISLGAAVSALMSWTGVGDPGGDGDAGFIKHKPSQRLGPGAELGMRSGPRWTVVLGSGRTVQRSIGTFANAEDAVHAAWHEGAVMTDEDIGKLRNEPGSLVTLNVVNLVLSRERGERVMASGAWIEIQRREFGKKAAAPPAGKA
jgi:hypothetical protein